MAIHSFQGNTAYILEGKAQQCFGSAKNYEGFLEVYADSEEAVRLGIVPVLIQGLMLALLSIFLYLMCKLYGF